MCEAACRFDLYLHFSTCIFKNQLLNNYFFVKSGTLHVGVANGRPYNVIQGGQRHRSRRNRARFP